MRIEIYSGNWNSKIVQKYPNKMFIFGDNNISEGEGGQAVIRNEPNAYGIPTKKYPNFDPRSFYTDKEFEENKYHIDKAITKIMSKSKNYDVIVLPENGFGTGLARLESRAPKTFEYVKEVVRNMAEELEPGVSSSISFLK